jgi:putative membrane-bound dehydrogenase-like protein
MAFMLYPACRKRLPIILIFTALASGCFVSQRVIAAEDARGGDLPTNTDGQPLNFDFETGTLADWEVTGNVFRQQPISGDTVNKRRSDLHSQHAGRFWIGTFEELGDEATGTLTSVPFVVRQPFATFLVGGGSSSETRVEVRLPENQQVIFSVSGQDNEGMQPVLVDLSKYMGQQVQIRLVDRSNAGWGHINFDDFRVHASKPTFPLRTETKAVAAAPLEADKYANAGLAPEAAAKAMKVPPGFKVNLFAGEPDVQQPIAMAIDDRGRLWIAEAYSYPIRLADAEAHDRILIFEDTNGDGHFDTRKVFHDKLNLVSGLELGFGGVWVGAAPNLLFIPDANGDDQPDGPPQILLDGWGFQDTHETLNAFVWGPDGWLYGCHGVFTHSRVGKPGTPDEKRVPINAGIWRYHPTRQEFEVFAHGTSNPWGVDFNDRGQCFCTACVIPHLYHVIQGARYVRQAGPHFNPFTFTEIATIAKHRHYLGATPHGGNNKSDAAGGGHAHAGAMVYLGGSWPAQYRDQIFMNNIHGARLNQDALAPEGSGYVGDRAPDFLFANDSWSQILYLTYGPDGQVYMIDWYDSNQCHHGNVPGHDRKNGRIFKISYENAKPVNVDLKKLSEQELVELQLNPNDWYARHSRRILQERGKQPISHDLLWKIAKENSDETRRLRALWALHVSQGLSEQELLSVLADDSPYVRGWGVQLACEKGRPTEGILHRFVELAKSDPSPIVRLYLSSACQRLPVADSINILRELVQHTEDAADPNIVPVVWYSVEAAATADPIAALSLWPHIKLPMIQGFLVRRLAQPAEPNIVVKLIDDVLTPATDPGQQFVILQAMNEAFGAKRLLAMPSGWPVIYARLLKSDDASIRTHATTLALTFGDPVAVTAKQAVMMDEKASLADRVDALNALVRVRTVGLAPMLQQLVITPGLNGTAIRALAAYDDPKTAEVLVGVYSKLTPAEQRDVLNTLASRPAYALALMNAVEAKAIPIADLSADLARQLRNLKDAKIDELISRLWGTLQDTPADRLAQITKARQMLSANPAAENKPDVTLGRAVFVKTCQQCHTLFGIGGKVGPELTGSNRANLDYALSNILDPSAAIGKDYQAQVIITTEGRTLTGIVREEDPSSLKLATANETIVLPKNEIEERVVSTKSMMPDDLLKPLKEREIRSLIAYLASPAQVSVKATEENAKTLFNGRDLTGWTGNPEVWSVENGEIVGRSPGAKRNEFLVSDMLEDDFTLALDVLLVDNQGNSGIQFRSEGSPNHMKGYQADVGVGWWGKLYEEEGRGVLWPTSGEPHVKPGEWNHYEIEARGSHVRTRINGQLCVDLEDPQGARSGVIAVQLHSGGPTEVRFKNFDLRVDDSKPVDGK